MKATVIILSYCQEATIARAIESVLAQECKYPFEILIADDCSTDNTRKRAEEFALSFPEKIRMMPPMPNRGIVGNYFDALKEAKGEYISDCAGDDEWLNPNRLQESIEILDRNPSCSVVFMDVEMYNVSAHQRKIVRSPLVGAPTFQKIKGQEILSYLLNHTTALPYILSSGLYRKSVLEEALLSAPDIIRSEASGIEDVGVIAGLAGGGIKEYEGYPFGDAIYLPLTGYRYYIDGESASNNLDHHKSYNLTARVATQIREIARFYGVPIKKQKLFFNQKFTYMATQVFYSGDLRLYEDFQRRRREWKDLSLPVKARIYLFLFRLFKKKIC